jgi:serine/threonine protein kinase
MNPERWDKLQAVFNQVIEHPVGERAAALAAACGVDEELRREVEELLAIDQGSGDTLRDAIGGAVADVVEGQRSKLLGAVIGAYRIVRILGHGGMGTVFLGERADKQFQQRVAIKLVEQMALHPQLRTRLRAERQILAHLESPYIARLIDGGETREGIPYLVIEYVEGKPLDEYCDENKLTVQQRLVLFEKVCAAVHYAHRNLIVHRDLKPANILVTADGTPKLLDFGIAKILSPETIGHTVAVTRVQDRLLTPEHASPEQVLGKPITTATDIYALGVLLYHLLCSRSPYANSNSTSIGLQRAICNEDPPRPSSLFHSPGREPVGNDKYDPDAVAANRGVTVQRLRRQLTGDLDEIILKATRKEPDQRYASAEQIVEDLRRHRAGQPILALQGGRRYRAVKFLRRNSLAVSLSGVVAASLIGFAVVMGLNAKHMGEQRDLAAKARDRAEQVSSFLVEIFGAADPFRAQGRESTARELLDRGAERIQREVTEPEIRAQMLETIGYAYQRQGLPDRAIPLLEESLEIRRRLSDQPNPLLATSMTNLATALRSAGKTASAEGYYRQSLALNRQLFGDGHERVAQVMMELGRLMLEGHSNVDETELFFKQSLEIYRSRLGGSHPEVASALSDLGNLMLWKDDLPGAESTLREALSIFQAKSARTHPDYAAALGSLGLTLTRTGELDEAETLLLEALELQRKVFGPTNPRVTSTLHALSSLYEQREQYHKAIRLLDEALVIVRQTRGEEYWEVGYYLDSLAKLHLKSGQLTPAEKQVHDALDIFRATLPADHLYIASSQHTLGEILLARGEYIAAEQPLLSAIDICTRTAGTDSWRAARSQSTLGVVLTRTERLEEGRALLTASLQTLQQTLGEDDALTRLARQRLAALQ